jgi:hemoglobin
MNDKAKTPFERIGGLKVLQKVAKIFYDKVYDHEWLGQYFTHMEQSHIESQQVDFMSGRLNGPKAYSGRFPGPAHEHMVISVELFDVRESLLEEAMTECNIPEDLKEIWHNIDRAFRDRIVKSADNPVKKRFFTDTILDFPKKSNKGAA